MIEPITRFERHIWTMAVLSLFSAGCGNAEPGAQTENTPGEETEQAAAPADATSELHEPQPGEGRLRNLQMLTFEGENAEAYFSADGTELIFQRTNPPEAECDQIFIMDVSGGNRRLASTGLGRTTCAYFFPEGDRIVYASTHASGPACPPPPDYSRGYVWALYDFDIYAGTVDGSELEVLFSSPKYDAEATISSDGNKIVFTSAMDGDLEIYTMNADGSDVTRLTYEPGYDGGPFFSPDGTKIVYRADHPTDPEALADYQALLAEDLVRPSALEIWVMDADGSNKIRLTDNGAANFAPFFHPGGDQIIFSSNLHDPDSRNFELYLINLDGTGLEQVTHFDGFDGFPMFTPDGKRLVFGSNRHNRNEGDTNVFIADWVEDQGEK